jgi:hypothetical protein
MRDISNTFRFRERWREGRFEYEELSGDLGVPGKVMKHRLIAEQNAVSAGTGEHAGHRIGVQFGAPGGACNLSLQNPNANTYAPKHLQPVFQGSGGNYLRLEREWARQLKDGYKIWVSVRDMYRPGEVRPISRKVTWIETTPEKVRMPARTLEFVNFGSPQSRAATNS